jgi:hypothetical protein
MTQQKTNVKHRDKYKWTSPTNILPTLYNPFIAKINKCSCYALSTKVKGCPCIALFAFGEAT